MTLNAQQYHNWSTQVKSKLSIEAEQKYERQIVKIPSKTEISNNPKFNVVHLIKW
jgi:hypothetical protein